jgi:uncharacterized protein YndB with AHSA1/START domain
MAGIVASAHITIAAPATEVWAALTDPTRIKEYMFGSTVATDWQPGSLITWTGEYNGQHYQDHGQIIAVDPPRRLELTHYSPMSEAADAPENYHGLTYELTPDEQGTRIELTQDNNQDEDAATHARQNWLTMLAALKQHVENTAAPTEGTG